MARIYATTRKERIGMNVDEALARADSWLGVNVRPEPAIAKAVAHALATEIKRMRAILAISPLADVWAEGDDRLFEHPTGSGTKLNAPLGAERENVSDMAEALREVQQRDVERQARQFIGGARIAMLAVRVAIEEGDYEEALRLIDEAICVELT